MDPSVWPAWRLGTGLRRQGNVVARDLSGDVGSSSNHDLEEESKERMVIRLLLGVM